MDAAEFAAVVDRRLKRCRETLVEKAKEYASDKDRLYNFKEAARHFRTEPGETPEAALRGMMRKHWVSLSDIVTGLEFGSGTVPTRAYLDEKLGDALNYLVLLEGLIVERMGPAKRPILMGPYVLEAMCDAKWEKETMPAVGQWVPWQGAPARVVSVDVDGGFIRLVPLRVGDTIQTPRGPGVVVNFSGKAEPLYRNVSGVEYLYTNFYARVNAGP